MGFGGFERRDRVRFQTNVLQQVICQVRFSHSFQIEEPSSIAGFQRELKERYPAALPREELLLELSVRGSQTSDVRTPSIYRFRDASGAWVVSLSPDWVGLETTGYTDYAEFRERLEQVVRLVEEQFEPAQTERIGFRYVNELPCGAKGDWRALIGPEFHGLAADDKVLDHLVESVEELHLVVEASRLNVRHGVVTKGDTQCYTFDIDAFSEARDSFDSARIVSVVDDLKARAWSFFRASITDELLSQLGTTQVP